jgi:glycosyltransferase involved in cell wall biosynthesis
MFAPTGAGRDAELACIVISYRDQPGVVDAVRSLVNQSEPVEVLVVNSGGGDPGARLAAAGISVPVRNHRERLFPGAARNDGIAATSAPLVSFLAADCVAEPGWAGARLRMHRDGADAVSGAINNATPASRSACASHLLLHHRRMPGALPGERLLFSLSYRRSVLERLGGFRCDLRQSEDTELNGRLDGARVVWGVGVVAAHAYPSTPLELARDQFRRGLRHARRQRLDFGRSVAPRLAFTRAREAVAHTRSFSEGRRMLARCAALLPIAVLAYFLGLVAGNRRCAST